MNLNQQEQIFLLHLLTDRVNHPNHLGWVNPMNKDMVFTHDEMVNLRDKIAEIQVEM